HVPKRRGGRVPDHSAESVVANPPTASTVRARVVHAAWTRLLSQRSLPPATVPPGCSSQTRTNRSLSGYGNGRISTPYTIENAAVVAPIPMASVRIAVVANAGFLPRARTA